MRSGIGLSPAAETEPAPTSSPIPVNMPPRSALTVLLVACASPPEAPLPHALQAPPAPAVHSVGQPQLDERARVIEAVQAGDFQGARDLLAELIVGQNVEQAEAALAEGQGESAMLLLDEALDLRPDDAELLSLRGQAAYAVAEAVVANPSSSANPQYFYEDALEHLLLAGSRYAAQQDREQVVRLAFAASRAARRIPAPERALDLARAGADRLAALEVPITLDPPAEQIHAEAAFDAFIALQTSGEDARETFMETEDQLMKLLGLQPANPWPLQQLSNLYQWAGDPARAISAIERALQLSPEVQALHDRLIQLVPAQRGWPSLVEHYSEFAALHPGSAVVQRNAGIATLFASLAAFDTGVGEDAGEDETSRRAHYAALAVPFQAADPFFERAAGLEEAIRAECLGYQAIVRNAIGWCHYNSGDYTAAKEAFLSMEDVFEGGLLWQLPGRLPDGVVGLDFVIRKLAEQPNSLSATEDVVEAAAIANYLFAYQPEDGNGANNSGFMNRDAAVLLERKGRVLRGQAERVEEESDRLELLQEAAILMDRAHELMDNSESAYRIAARLLPDDVRVINDAGLVIVYYTRKDPEAAERLFLRAVELGELQLQDSGLSDEDRYDLNEAWGDAHQNLAILELTLRRNGAKARAWLERALDIGPASREQIGSVLETCDELAKDPDLDLSLSPIVRNLVWLHSPRR